jgi:PAS domain S-box-containing protein
MSSISSEENRILNSVSDGVTINSQGVFVYVNETFAKMVGYRVSELTGMSSYEIVAPDYVEIVKERTKSRQQGKDVVSVYEVDLVRRDGSRFPVEINVNRIDYMGKSSSITTIRDITHKKETEQRFEDLLRLAPVAIMTYSITGHISSCNQATLDMTGYSNEELVGKHLTQLPFFNLETVKMTLPLLTSLISGQAIGPVDFPYKSKTGENKYARAYPRLVTSSNGAREILVVIEDTTEATTLMNSLQASEELFRGFMHSATDAFTIFDQDMRFEEVNRSWIQMTNHKKEDVIGKHILDIYIGLRETGRYDAYLKVLETGKPVEFYAVQTKVGRGMIYDVSAFKVGNMLGVVAKDVTERTLISESLRASEERFRLLYENAPLGYQSLDENGCLIEVSKAWLLLTGYTQDEVIGKWFGDFLTPQYIDQFRLNFPRFKAKGETQVQFEMIRKDESIILVSIFGKVGYNAKREFQQTHCILEDVTEKNRIENKLRSSEDLFRGFMQSSTEAFLLLDKSMQYIDVNDTWLQQSGLKREEVIGKHMLELFPELKDNGRYDAYVKVMETGEPVEFPIVPSVVGQGTVFDISAFSTGDYLGIISRDVSDRLRYQSRLEALHGHAASLSSAETMDEVANITREYLVQNFGFNLGALSIVENDLLANRYIWGAEPIQNSFTRLDGPGIIVEVVKTGKTQNIGDVRENPLYIAGFAGEVILSELAVPVTVSQKAVGVLNLESDVLNAYSENDQRLVETLASHVASAFSKIKYNQRLNELYGFSIELGTTESVNEVIETSFRIMREIFGFQFSSFQLLEEDGLVSVGTTDNSNLGVVFPLSGKGITTRAAREKRTMLVGDVRLDSDYLPWSIDSRSELAVPILGEDRVLGVLNVESIMLEAFNDDDARLLELLAQNVASALNRVRSIADRKQVTDALLESEERLSGFMESATESFILLDSELNILDANPTWLKLTGFSQTVIGKNLQDVLPVGEVMSSRYSAYKRVIETGQSVEFIQTVSPSNENVFYDVKAFKVGEGLGVIVTDVTDQTIANRLLQESEKKFQLFLDSATDPIILMDKDLTIVYANPAWLKYTEIDKNVVGIPILDIYSNLQDTGRYDAYLKVIETGESAVFSDIVGTVNVSRTGNIKAFKVGDGVGLLIEDITDRVERDKIQLELMEQRIETESAREVSDLKDQFIATATHELRTPVTSILGYIELIMEDPNRIISDPVRKDLNVVLRNSHRLVSFVNDLLDVQRITAGKLEAKLEPADLISTLDEVVSEMSHLFSEKDQVLRVETPERVVVSVNEPRVSQLFINLLRNANKFTPEGEQVTISVEPDENHVRVSVKDTGVGLSEEEIGKLFVPFPSINRELGGTSTGLGLAICKGIVDMHGGEIWAKSEGHGKGSTFTFTLPIEQ